MPITPRQIRERKGRVEFTFAGEPVWVEYAAALMEGITQDQADAWQEEIEACETPAQTRAVLAKMVSDYVTAWDVVERINPDGTLGPMFPLTPERLVEHDALFLMRVWSEVMKDVAQVKPDGTA
jgi:hypothetical protein